ncbi:MAG TPA: hypothetical protein VHC63_14400 [Acidimicrobiales bacterium]|nr:hypothetical protein [Acidimicrobiales bacterium]
MPLRDAVRALARCVTQTFVLLVRREIVQPSDNVGAQLHFADGTTGRVYRETQVQGAAGDDVVQLVVGFRLRGVRGWGHALFRAESLLNTPLFVGFPGFVSKLWVAADENGLYRGVYEWNGAALALAYVRALWWVLALVSYRSSIDYAVVPGVRRAAVLAGDEVRGATAAWWRVTGVASYARQTR